MRGIVYTPLSIFNQIVKKIIIVGNTFHIFFLE